MDKQKRSSWSGQLAFVLAAAASAIGLGNLWRFPYLAAKYGGGVFIAVYIVLSLTLGFTLLVTEIAIGRYSRQSQLTAFNKLGHPKWNFLGVLSTVVPLFILPYYNVIGGWVAKYFVAYVRLVAGGGTSIENPQAFFDSFVTAPWDPFRDVRGDRDGREERDREVEHRDDAAAAPDGRRPRGVHRMPPRRGRGHPVLPGAGLLLVRQHRQGGARRDGADVLLALARDGDHDHLRQLHAASFVAVLSGFMIIPVVVMFAAKSGAGRATIDAGPGLMFVTLPKVFAEFGATGAWIGLAFFTLVLFAALTSAISMTEACVAAVCDYLHVKRNTSVAAVCAWCAAVGSLSAFGYGRWSGFKPFGLPALDFFDSSMNVLTPIVAALICVFAGWVLRPKRILAECRRDGSAVGFKSFYAVMVKFIAPLLVLGILVSEICRTLGIGGWKI